MLTQTPDNSICPPFIGRFSRDDNRRNGFGHQFEKLESDSSVAPARRMALLNADGSGVSVFFSFPSAFQSRPPSTHSPRAGIIRKRIYLKIQTR